MKRRRFMACAVAALMLFSAIPNRSYALLESDKVIQEKTGQPFSSYWYPDELLKWNYKNDKDAKFNTGTVDLQKRVGGKKIKDSQSENAKVVSLAIANKTTSSTPSQGKDTFDGYNFSYWQYIDTMVAWGGSSGEGLIVPPSADLIDASHLNGVPVLGTVFFPPKEYGGKIEWMKEFLVKDKKGNFPMADKLLEVAKSYNFDGWFINQETGDRVTLEPELADLMKEFLAYIQKKKPKDMEIIWYDSMLDDGRVFWQNELNEYNKNFFGTNKKKLSDGMFLNFWWTNSRYAAVDPNNNQGYLIHNVTGNELKESADLAKEMKRDPFDLYAGVDVQANGYNTQIKWDYLFPKDKEANTSLGLYCPSWTYDSSKDVNEFLDKESKFWVSETGDPRHNNEGHWKGIANYVVEKSPVTSLPFVTNFSMGNGKFFNVDGVKVSDNEWNHRGMMDVMPTYRWIVDNDKNDLRGKVDYTQSYYGGNSVSFDGKLSSGGKSDIKLYAADVKLSQKSEIGVTYKTNSDDFNLKLKLVVDKKTQIVDLKCNKDGQWTKASASLSKFKNKKLEEISLVVEGKSNINDFKLNIGQLALKESNKGHKLNKIKDLKVDEFKVIDNYYGNVRLTWDKGNKDVKHYEIYTEDVNGNRKLVGSTPTNAFYIKDIERDLTLNSKIKFVVKPISKVLTTDSKYEASVEVSWPNLEAPKANFEVDNSIITPGSEVNFKDRSLAGNKVSWNIEGIHKNEQLEGENVTVKFDKPGVYTVTQTVSNEAGSTINKQEDFIVVSSQASGGLVNLGLNKEAKANSQTNENEGAKFAFDGSLSSKWCAFGESGNWIEVDLGKESIIKELKMSHAQAGGEAKSMNTMKYSVEVSNDKHTWKKLSDIVDNSDGVSRDDLNYEKARYVRVNINKSEQGNGGATRIYEIEVLGLNADKIIVLDNKDALIDLFNITQKLEKDYSDLGKKDEEFEKSLFTAKNIIDLVEVDSEEILKAKNSLVESFDNISGK